MPGEYSDVFFQMKKKHLYIKCYNITKTAIIQK